MLKLNDLCQKSDLVFVGGFAMFKHGLKSNYRDVDVVVQTLSGLESATTYTTDSLFSTSGKRAGLKAELFIDIFIEEKLPESIQIGPYRVATIAALTQYYVNLIEHVKSDHLLSHIHNNLKLLKYE